jgi:hypothetical protein
MTSPAAIGPVLRLNSTASPIDRTTIHQIRTRSIMPRNFARKLPSSSIGRKTPTFVALDIVSRA